MKWTDLRKLEVGDVIVYGDHQQTRKCSYTREGVIQHVTVKGGIKVNVVHEGRETSTTQWVPYHHVISFPRKQRAQRAA